MSRRVLFLTSLLIVTAVSVGYGNEYVTSPVKPPDAGPLFRIRRGGKWGFMDRTGKTVIRPRFDAVGDFFSGRAHFTAKERCGFIDEAGKQVIAASFEACGNFREGLAPVRTGRSWGYVRTDGTFAIPAQFQGAGEFHEGLARVETWERLRCLGTEGLMTEFDRANAPEYAFYLSRNDFMEQLCDYGQQGFIDPSGEVVIPYRPGPMGDFSEGRVWFRETGTHDSLWGFLDRTGSVAIKPTLTYSPRDFHGGLLSHDFGGEEHLSGAMDVSGNIVIQPRFKRLGDFKEGLAEACEESYSCGYVDSRGQWVIPPQFESGSMFQAGLARVWSKLLRPQYIDPTGKTILVLGKDDFAPWPFIDGLTVVEDVKSSRYVDRTGKTVAIYDDTPKRR